MNTPTPTPRTDAAWSSSFEGKQLSAGQTARALRECSQKLESELAALRSENATLRAAQKACEACDEPTAFEVRQLRAVFPQICAAIGNGAFCTPTVSVGFIQSIPNEVQLVVAELRARAERAEAAQSVALHHAHNLFKRATRAERAKAAQTVALANWNGALERAMKAEAEVTKLTGFYNEIVVECGHDLIVREYRQRGELLRGETNRRKKAEAELATERARLDWLESDAGVDWQWSSSALTIRRAVIDAAMKEDAQ